MYNKTECEMDAKKMILSQIMSAVKVSRDYEIEIEFTVDYEQFGGQAHLRLPAKIDNIITTNKAIS